MDEPTSLLLAAREGDRFALAAFVRATQADVWRFCAHLVDAQSADDLAQDVYVRAFAATARFRGDASARTWLLSIARRTCADELRRRRRERLRDAKATPPPPQPSAEGLVDLTLLLAALDRERREAFVLTQVIGLPYEEAARACRVPIGTIRSRVARARRELVGLIERSQAPTGASKQ
jgi:RNA polymerase sigma-70 factor (ECF subfamily)